MIMNNKPFTSFVISVVIIIVIASMAFGQAEMKDKIIIEATDPTGTGLYFKQAEIEIKPGQNEYEVNFDVPATILTKLEGKKVPEFKDIKGWINSRPLKFADLKGKVVLIDFWSGYPGTYERLPELIRLHNKYAGKGFVIVAVYNDTLDSVSKLQEKVKELSGKYCQGQKIPFAIALDGGGVKTIEGTSSPALSAFGSTNALYGINSWPTSVLIDKKGNLIGQIFLNDRLINDLEKEIEKSLGLKTDESSIGQTDGKELWGNPVNGLQVEILPEKKVFTFGEPVNIKWFIRNISKEDKTIIWHDLQYLPVLFEIGNKGGEKIIRNDSRRIFNDAHPFPPDKLVLRPGDIKEGVFDLRYFGLSESKQKSEIYEVTGLYSPKDSDFLKIWIDKDEYKDAVTDRIDSAAIEIVIEPIPAGQSQEK